VANTATSASCEEVLEMVNDEVARTLRRGHAFGVPDVAVMVLDVSDPAGRRIALTKRTGREVDAHAALSRLAGATPVASWGTTRGLARALVAPLDPAAADRVAGADPAADLVVVVAGGRVEVVPLPPSRRPG
jgi:hypothetical protein